MMRRGSLDGRERYCWRAEALLRAGLKKRFMLACSCVADAKHILSNSMRQGKVLLEG